MENVLQGVEYIIYSWSVYYKEINIYQIFVEYRIQRFKYIFSWSEYRIQAVEYRVYSWNIEYKE